jgi:predicted secreted Zn-dependent protease
VTLDVVVTLPEWMPAAELDPNLQVAWGRFRRALGEHEHQHRVIALGGAHAAYKAVAGLYRSSCDAAVTEARARLERLGVEVSAAHRRFDEETSHGKTTGAYWPQ